MATSTNPESTFEEINAFLKTLQDYPGGLHVRTAPVSFIKTTKKDQLDGIFSG